MSRWWWDGSASFASLDVGDMLPIFEVKFKIIQAFPGATVIKLVHMY